MYRQIKARAKILFEKQLISKLVKATIRITSSINRGFLVLWALAIFWFYLGNLINFHQNRIWGKILIPSCFTHSSANTKDFASLQMADDDFDYTLSTDNFIAVNDSQVLCVYPVVKTLHNVYYPADNTLIPFMVSNPNLLRGPPTA